MSNMHITAEEVQFQFGPILAKIYFTKLEDLLINPVPLGDISLKQ